MSCPNGLHAYDHATQKCVHCGEPFSFTPAKTQPTARERMRDWLGSREAYAAGADETDFIFKELDDIRGQLARALGQLAMMGLPEPPTDGVHVHARLYEPGPIPSTAKRKWICTECLAEGTVEDPLPGQSYKDFVAKKRERSGG